MQHLPSSEKIHRRKRREEGLKENLFTDQFVATLAKEIGLQTIAGREALKVALENIVLLDMKQADYGPHNISAFGLFGVIVRTNDKIERLKNLNGYTKEQKAVLKKLKDSMQYLERNWHTLSMLQTLDALEDAITQFKVLFAKKRKPVVKESMLDTFRDICNYSIIALLLESGKWPTEEPQPETPK